MYNPLKLINKQQRLFYSKIFRDKQNVTQIEIKNENSSYLRLSKYLARNGVCSRREADELIKEGKVTVNDEIATVGKKITPTDKIIFKGKKLLFDASKLETKIYMFRKSVGVICGRVDNKGRPTIYDYLKNYNFNHLMKIGRLDYNTEGLLLLTNDGELARSLELPSSNIRRKYLVKIFGNVTSSHLEKFAKGSFIDGVHYGKMKTKIIKELKNYTWIEVELFEGKNREIRNVFNHMNMNVCRLIRTEYGPYKLNASSISKNQLKEVKIHQKFLKYCETIKP
eukprot:gene5338-9147_t